jgi:hypothetical protein
MCRGAAPPALSLLKASARPEARQAAPPAQGPTVSLKVIWLGRSP